MARDPRQRRPPIGRRVSGLVSRASERVDDFRTPLGLAVLALAAFLAFTAFKATTGPPFLPKYRITVRVPADAPSLRKGEAVRVGGSLAGLIDSVEPDTASGQTLVRVNISKTNFRPLPVDTQAFVRVHSIVYLTYLALTPGTSKETLKDGDTLRAPAQSGTDLLEVVQLFDKQARQNLSKTLVNVGFGVAGRGEELNGALRDLPSTATYLGAQLRAATRTPGSLEKLISGADRTAAGLRGRRAGDVAGLIDAGNTVFGTTASRRDQLGRALDLLRPFEDAALSASPAGSRAFSQIAAASGALTPTVRALRGNLPGLVTLTGLGPQLRDGFAALLGGGAGGATGAGVGGSGGTATGNSGIANQVLIAARPVVSGLYPIQTSVRPLNASLAKLLDAVDPYLPEIANAGQRLQKATSSRLNAGTRPGAPVFRLLPVLTPHPCVNALPAPGQAEQDKMNGGSC